MSDYQSPLQDSPGLGRQVAILTVEDLRRLIADLPDDTQVIVNLQSIEVEVDIDDINPNDGTGRVPPPEFANVAEVHVPDFDESFALELRVEDTYDGRQT